MKTTRWLGGCVAVAALVSGGCLDILGHKDRTLDPALATGGAGGSGAEGGQAGTGATGGGGDGGGAMVCEPGAQQACYGGPADTQGVGICKGGMSTCAEDGSGWGACEGEVLPAQETCKGKEDEDCDGFECVLWSRAFGDSDPAQFATAIVPAPDGGAFLTGAFSGVMQFGDTTLISSDLDVFLAKLDENGVAVWARQFGAAGFQLSRGAAVDSEGNVTIVGLFGGDVSFGGDVLSGAFSGLGAPVTTYVAKFDGAGQHLWSKAYDVQVRSVAVDSAGEVVLTGLYVYADAQFDGITLANGGNVDIFVAKLGAQDGNAIWAKGFGGPGDEEGATIAIDPAGNIGIAGTFDGTLNIVGQPLSTGGPPGDVFLARLDPQGAPLWSQQLPGAGKESATALVADGLGSLYLAGTFDGSINVGGTVLPSKGGTDAFLLKVGPGGEFQWGAQLGSTKEDSAIRAALTPAAGVAVLLSSQGDLSLGGTTLPAAGASDVVVAMLDGTGSYGWSRRFGDDSDQSSGGIGAGATGEVWIAANFSGKIDFGGHALVSNDSDIAVAKLAK